jgi:UDP:flavonoid glycosyltransferase YjiC (YdhE family)
VQGKLNADQLAAAIDTAIRDSGIRDAARCMARCIADEDGAARVLSAVESLLHPA